MEIKPITEWRTPVTALPNKVFGRAELTTDVYDIGFYDAYRTNGCDFWEAKQPVDIRFLKIGGEVWMVDDPPHWWAMQEHARRYSGKIVIAGLGLGLIVHALAENPAVQELLIYEREQDVIGLMEDTLPKNGQRRTIICDDFWNHTGHADGVFFDLFVGDGRALVTQMIRTKIVLAERYPFANTIRIHGASNDYLDKMVSQVTTAVSITRKNHE